MLFNISYQDLIVEFHRKIQTDAEEYDKLLTLVESWKLYTDCAITGTAK